MASVRAPLPSGIRITVRLHASDVSQYYIWLCIQLLHVCGIGSSHPAETTAKVTGDCALSHLLAHVDLLTCETWVMLQQGG